MTMNFGLFRTHYSCQLEQYTAVSLNESPSNTSLQQPVAGCPSHRVCRVGDGVDDMAGAGVTFSIFLASYCSCWRQIMKKFEEVQKGLD